MAGGSLFKVGESVELWRVLEFLSILVIFIVIFEKLLHSFEHYTSKYPKYHEMISKAYRELMILGFIGLGIKMVKEAGWSDPYAANMTAFQIADLMVFVMAIALILQAIAVYLQLRRDNLQIDKAELMSSKDLLDRITHNEALITRKKSFVGCWCFKPCHSKLDGMVKIRILRHYFLRTHGLPELFPFSKYLRQAQDNQITHMIDVEVSQWILLLFGAWALDACAELLIHLDHETEDYALVCSFFIFVWGLVSFHLLVTLYLDWCLRKILSSAGCASNRDMTMCLSTIAAQESRLLANEVAGEALELMQQIQEEQEIKQFKNRHKLTKNDTGFQLIATCFRHLCSTSQKHKEQQQEQQQEFVQQHREETITSTSEEVLDGAIENKSTKKPQTKKKHGIPFFSRKVWHFLIKMLLMFNGLYVALFIECILYQLCDVTEKFGWFPTIMIPLPLVLNIVFLQPHIMQSFVLISNIWRVDVETLSDVVVHFNKIVELRCDFMANVHKVLVENGKSVADLHREFDARDPSHAGLIEVEDLRLILGEYGFHLSFFKFNSVAKLLFQLKGTKVEYLQVEVLLSLAKVEQLHDQPQGFHSADKSASSSSSHLAVPIHPDLNTMRIISEDEREPSFFSEDRDNIVLMRQVSSLSMNHDDQLQYGLQRRPQRTSRLYRQSSQTIRSLYHLDSREVSESGGGQESPVSSTSSGVYIRI